MPSAVKWVWLSEPGARILLLSMFGLEHALRTGCLIMARKAEDVGGLFGAFAAAPDALRHREREWCGFAQLHQQMVGQLETGTCCQLRDECACFGIDRSCFVRNRRWRNRPRYLAGFQVRTLHAPGSRRV